MPHIGLGERGASIVHGGKKPPQLLAERGPRQRIQGCKRELAKSVVHLPTTEALQKEVDALKSENRDLKQWLALWQNYYAGRGITLSNLVQAPTNPPPRHPPVTRNPAPAPRQETITNLPPTNPGGRTAAPNVAHRQHTIASGDTLASVAKKYNVRLPALQAANPRVDARRLRPGQTLVIPSP